MNVSRRTGDLASGGVCFLIGVWYLYVAFRDLLFWTPGNQPGGGFFPVLLGSSLLVLSFSLVLRGLRTRLESSSEASWIDRKAISRPGWVLLALAAWVFLFPYLGYIISTWLLTGGLMWFFAPSGTGRRRLLASGGISGLAVLGFYFVFGVAFNLQLPAWPALG